MIDLPEPYKSDCSDKELEAMISAVDLDDDGRCGDLSPRGSSPIDLSHRHAMKFDSEFACGHVLHLRFVF
jgi:hypothetical protein